MDGKIHIKMTVSVEGQTEAYDRSLNQYSGVEDELADELKKTIMRAMVKYEMRNELRRLQ